jgi:ankyrin repeat protein
MDIRFHPAMQAIKSGDTNRLRELVRQDPSLATGRSKTSHPTLLQCLVLDARDNSAAKEMAEVLIHAGAELNAPLIACSSCDNVTIAELLMDRGATVDSSVGKWSPIEEALYWNSQGMIALLLQRGASIHNLRIAAGLGRTDLIETFFNNDGSLKSTAGSINWPWGGVDVIKESNFNAQGRDRLVATVSSWSNDAHDIVNNAFVYACMHGHVDAATLLLKKGAEINTIPGGFDFAGTGLHYAALNGHREMVEFLIQQGADRNMRDTKVGSTPAGWAEHGGHPELKRYLEGT